MSDTRRTPRNNGKISYLDGIRGVACLMVAFHHYVLAVGCIISRDPKGVWLFRAPWKILKNGDLAVSIFFLISGRVLAESFRKRRDVKILVSAMVRRAFRLGIPVFFILLISSAYAYHFKVMDSLEYWKNTKGMCVNGQWDYVVPYIRTFSRSFKDTIAIFTLGVHPDIQGGILWTIPIEFQQSFTVYALALVCANVPFKWPLLVSVTAINLPYLRASSLFILGYFFSELEQTSAFKWFVQRDRPFSLKWLIKNLVWFITLYHTIKLATDPEAQLSLRRLLRNNIPLRSDNIERINAITSILFMLICSTSPLLQWFFTTPPLRFLGKISFGLYLIHSLFTPHVRVYVASMIGSGYSPYEAFKWTLFFAFLPVSIAASTAFYYLIDYPTVSVTSSAYKEMVEKWKETDLVEIVKPAIYYLLEDSSDGEQEGEDEEKERRSPWDPKNSKEQD